MMRPSHFVSLAAFLLVSSACSVQTPVAPASSVPPGGAAADGSTLKAGAPQLVSPINDATVQTSTTTLVITAASALFSAQSFSYQFELQTDAGSVVGSATVGGTSWSPSNQLGVGQRFRWRARAVSGTAVGPWSSFGTFQSPRITIPTFASSNDDWKTWFFAIVDLRGVGPIASAAGLTALMPDFTGANVILETDSGGHPRGRIYLPTGSSTNLYSRSVDLGSFGQPWQWQPRGGTVCEGGNCPK